MVESIRDFLLRKIQEDGLDVGSVDSIDIDRLYDKMYIEIYETGYARGIEYMEVFTDE